MMIIFATVHNFLFVHVSLVGFDDANGAKGYEALALAIAPHLKKVASLFVGKWTTVFIFEWWQKDVFIRADLYAIAAGGDNCERLRAISFESDFGFVKFHLGRTRS